MELCGLVSGLFPKKSIPLKLQLWALWLCIFNFQQIFSSTFNINTSFISDAGRGKFRGVSQNNAGLQDEGDVQAEHGGARPVHVPAGHPRTGPHTGPLRPLPVTGGYILELDIPRCQNLYLHCPLLCRQYTPTCMPAPGSSPSSPPACPWCCPAGDQIFSRK